MAPNLGTGVIFGLLLGLLCGLPLCLAFHEARTNVRGAWTHGAVLAVIAGVLVVSATLEASGPEEPEPTSPRQEAWFNGGRAAGLAIALTGWGISLRRRADADDDAVI